MTKDEQAAIVQILTLAQGTLRKFVIARLTGKVLDSDDLVWSDAMATINSIERGMVWLRPEPTMTIDGVDMSIGEATELLRKMALRQALQNCIEALEYAQTGNRRPEVIGAAIANAMQALAVASGDDE